MPYLIQNPDSPNQIIYELRFGENTLGRELGNSIIVMDASISRHHAKVKVKDNYIIIEDLNSSNSTFINDKKINRCQVNEGDLIRCGSVVFKFVDTLGIHEDPNISIVRSLAPDRTRVKIDDLLHQDTPENQTSVLKLRQQDTNQRALDKLKILLEVSRQLSSPDEPDRLLERILDLLFRIVNVDRAVILLVNEKTRELENKAAKFRCGIPTYEQFYSTNITNYVRQRGEAILTDDACNDERFGSLSISIIGQAIHASMCVPLKPREEVIGVLYADNLSMGNIYSEEDLEFLTALANQAAIAIENTQLYKQIQEEAVVRTRLERFFPEAVRRRLQEEDSLRIVETEVTALFCDISSFTEMSSRMQPRQVIEMLNEYFQVMVENIVFPYEGTLEKYIGDALLAIWGAPYPLTDDADRAVKAAIKMQMAVRSLNLNQQWIQRHNFHIHIHIGINTGNVAAGNIGSPRLIQYATIGDTTNVSSRICSAASADEILISQSTLDKLGDRTIPIEAIPPVSVRGIDQPLQLYRVLWNQVVLGDG